MAEGHGGNHAVAVARAHGIETMFTLSGAHVFPMYDAAVKGDQQMRLVDVRHEQTAVFAAEATAKLTRRPGLAVLTAGPGVTNGISAVTSAWFNGSPLLVVGGRAPAYRWGTGSLQELDHPPLLAPVTKRAATVGGVEQIAAEVDDALRLAIGTASRPGVPRRADGPVLQPRRRGAARARRRGDASGAGPGRGHVDRRAAGVGAAAGAGHRVGRLGRRRRGGCAAAGGDRRPAGDHQRDGPRHPACRAPAAGDAGPFAWPSARPTWSWWWAPRWTSGSATAPSARRTIGQAHPSYTWPTPPAR